MTIKNFTIMENLRKQYNPIIVFSKFTFIQKILKLRLVQCKSNSECKMNVGESEFS